MNFQHFKQISAPEQHVRTCRGSVTYMRNLFFPFLNVWMALGEYIIRKSVPYFKMERQPEQWVNTSFTCFNTIVIIHQYQVQHFHTICIYATIIIIIFAFKLKMIQSFLKQLRVICRRLSKPHLVIVCHVNIKHQFFFLWGEDCYCPVVLGSKINNGRREGL